MSLTGDKPTGTVPAINNDDDNDESDVELEGMDLEGDEGGDDDDVDMEPAIAATDEVENNVEVAEKLATEDHDELEAAHREQKELMAAERNKVAPVADDGNATMEDKLQFLLSQSEVFAHFLAGSVAASNKKGGNGKKKGSRGKKNRMTEAEEDAQLLKTAQSKRSVIRLNKQVRHLIISKKHRVFICLIRKDAERMNETLCEISSLNKRNVLYFFSLCCDGDFIALYSG